jgi:hypothetical protein
MADLRKKSNFLSLKESSNYVLLKNLFKSHLLSPLSFTERSKNNPMPMLPVLRHSTASYEKSLEHRGRKLWNDLPKDWVLNDMSYAGFCLKIKEWIVKKRNNEFIYYSFY